MLDERKIISEIFFSFNYFSHEILINYFEK